VKSTYSNIKFLSSAHFKIEKMNNKFLQAALLLLITAASAEVKLSKHYAPNSATNQIATCYVTEYTYFTSTVCSGACPDTFECDIGTDPRDFTERDAKHRRNRLLAITLPSVFGGLLLLTSLCLCCVAYYACTACCEFMEKRKRAQRRVQPRKQQQQMRK
jgi:hypothetical protein